MKFDRLLLRGFLTPCKIISGSLVECASSMTAIFIVNLEE